MDTLSKTVEDYMQAKADLLPTLGVDDRESLEEELEALLEGTLEGLEDRFKEGIKLIEAYAEDQSELNLLQLQAASDAIRQMASKEPPASPEESVILSFADTDMEEVRKRLIEELRFSNSYSRLPILLNFSGRIPDSEWLSHLGECWSGCDNVGKYIEELKMTPFGSDHTLPEMMNEDEKEELRRMPSEFEIYRGCYHFNKWGLSWTLDRSTAEKFPSLNRYRADGQKLLVRARVKKENVIALKLDRKEMEIITWLPRHISTSHIRA